MDKFRVGDYIENRYEILKIFGQSIRRMGVVLICQDLERNEPIVLKTFKRKYLLSKIVVDSFKHEALTWILLKHHPNIVKAKYIFEMEGQIFIALEYIIPDEFGRYTLQDFFNEGISIERFLSWNIQFCLGMEHAKMCGIYPHRDIKPTNILITRDKILKISDFGIARIWDKEKIIPNFKEIKNRSRPEFNFICSSDENIVAGSYLWMAPEAFKGRADIRSDIYSFGIVMYQMLNKGKLPHSNEILKNYYMEQNLASKKFDLLELYTLIDKCIQIDPKKRYQDFLSLRIDLEKIYKIENGIPFNLVIEKDSQDLWEHYDKGISYLTLGFPDKAIDELESDIELRGKNAESLMCLGIALGQKELYKDAINKLKESIDLNPKIYKTYFELGKIYQKMSLFQDSIQYYLISLKLNSLSARIYLSLGKAYETIGNIQDAIKNYQIIVNSKKFPNIFKKEAKTRIHTFENGKVRLKNFLKDLR